MQIEADLEHAGQDGGAGEVMIAASGSTRVARIQARAASCQLKAAQPRLLTPKETRVVSTTVTKTSTSGAGRTTMHAAKRARFVQRGCKLTCTAALERHSLLVS